MNSITNINIIAEDCIDTISRINLSKDLKSLLIDSDNKKSCCGDFETLLLNTNKDKHPEDDCYHPSDVSGLPDIFSRTHNEGYEVKCAFPWSNKQIEWRNQGNVTSSENFLFILFDREVYENERKLKIKRAYYGYMSYTDWEPRWNKGKQRGWRITTTTVKKFCKQII